MLKKFVFMGALLLNAPAWSDTVVFEHARIIDGTGADPWEDATLVLQDDRIVQLEAGNLTPPAGARVVDARGKTILPGLISNHSHVGQTDDLQTGPDAYTRENITRQLVQYQRYGVTTITSLGLNRPLLQELRRQAHAGELPGADLFGVDRGLGAPGGAPPVQAADDQLLRPATPEEARAAVAQMAERQTDLIKLWVDDFQHSLPGKMSPEIYRAAITEAHRRGLRVAAHVYYLEDARQLVEAGVDILAHGVRDAEVDDSFVQQIKKAGTWYIPTLQVDESFYVYAEQPDWMRSPFFRNALQPQLAARFSDPDWRSQVLNRREELGGHQAALLTNLKNTRKLFQAGVHIGFGADSGANPLRIPGFAEHREIQLLIEAGLSPLQAITVATGQAASLLQLTDRGRVQPGLRADLLIVDGNPTHDQWSLQRIDSVWQRGVRVAGADS